MLRHGCGLGATLILFQVQNRESLLATHGAGLIKHHSLATAMTDAKANLPRGVTQAAPAADLFRSKVHEGLGTSASDPYFRTLPNQESRTPESSVLQNAAAFAPSMDEVMQLSKKWGTMQYWIGDQYPRLPLYLEQLLVPHALPVSPQAEDLIGELETQIAIILLNEAKEVQEMMLCLWRTAVRAYSDLSTRHIFNRRRFEAELEQLHAEKLSDAQKIASVEEIPIAFEVLRRRAVLKRNTFIRDGLVPFAEHGAYLGFGDGVWHLFFEAVAQKRAELFGQEEDPILEFTWDAIMKEDMVRTPSVTACVALFFIMVSVAQSGTLVKDESLQSHSRRVDEGVGGAKEVLSDKMFPLVNPIQKRKFVSRILREMLESEQGACMLSKALRAHGLLDLSREVALCEAMNADRRFLEADVAEIVTRFDSTVEVKSLLTSIMGGTNEAARHHVARTFSVLEKRASIDWDKTFTDLDWSANWRCLVVELLSDSATLAAVHQLIKNAIGAKGSVRRLFNKECEEELQNILGIRQARAVNKSTKVSAVVSEMSSFQNVDLSLQILQELGIPMVELVEEAAALEKRLRIRRPAVDPVLMDLLLEAIRERHPTWVKAGVLPSTCSSQCDSTQILSLMVRIFVRLTYVPHAGAASIAQHTRRRIGTIGKELFQYNVPTEMGFVEHYNNLQYKRYDWQGWYQRMVDIHNRNVSIRCRIDDLKRLDNFGAPFVDLQTERRLRILSQERVGMGVLKLDSDKYEDQPDNITHGCNKLSELLADSRKAQLGPEYWPTVEVKVRKPSGQSQAHYSILDYDRIEQRSKELYLKYRDMKKHSLFVTPMNLWLEVKGMQIHKAADSADAEGYTADDLQDSLSDN